ncbi:hypothetical protein KHQ81_12125 [Mycoplasmatota bacterium]|nr:hypothetical protein KHQ81_12125 [Mycoplasmatota bacterium]
MLKDYRNSSELVKRHFKVMLLVLSIFVATVTGILHIKYLKTFVVPDLLYCTYYDDYHYKLYSFETGCKKLELIEKEYDGNNQLSYLKYEINNHGFERSYESGNIKKTIETIYNEKIMLENNIPLIIDEKVITTTYEYQDTSFKQSREIKYIANGYVILIQHGYYSAIHSDEDVSPVYLYNIKIEKSLMKPELLYSKNELIQTVFTSSYLYKKLDERISVEQYIDTLMQYVKKIDMINYTDIFWVYKAGVTYNLNGYNGQFSYIDEEVDAWRSYDNTYEYKNRNSDKENPYTYYQYKNHVLTSSIFADRIHLKVTCNDKVNYCDGSLYSYGTKKIYRYLITKKESITKVDVYNLYGKRYFDQNRSKIEGYTLTGKKIEIEYAPFDDYYIQSSEIFEEPKPYIKIK